MLDLFDRRILYVGGKGGVGKTTVAASLALMAAKQGKACLVVSTDPAHSLGDIFDRDIGARETALAPGLHGLEIDPDGEADRYLKTVKQNMRSLVRPELYGEIDRQMDLARHAPGAAEAAMLDRVADLMIDAQGRHDLVVFDTAPTGHTIRLLSLPEVMAAWTDGMLRHQERSKNLGRVLKNLGGKRSKGDELSLIDGEEPAPGGDTASRIQTVLLERRRKFHRARRHLLDAAITGFVLVLIPERLPILESRKALHILRHFHVPVSAMVVNRVLPDQVDGDFFKKRREQEERYRKEIDETFASIRRIEVPLLESDVQGIETLERIGRMLTG